MGGQSEIGKSRSEWSRVAQPSFVLRPAFILAMHFIRWCFAYNVVSRDVRGALDDGVRIKEELARLGDFRHGYQSALIAPTRIARPS